MKAKNNGIKSVVVSVLFFSLILFTGGCQHSDKLVEPKPDITIKVGYFGQEAEQTWTFTTFPNQQQISFENFQTYTQNSLVKGFMLRLDEYGVKCQTINYHSGAINAADVMNGLQYPFQVSTSTDSETFVTGKNGWAAGKGSGSDAVDNYCILSVDYLMPVKFIKDRSRLKEGSYTYNDTLEISPVDTIRIKYRSLYTSREASAKIIITK